MNKGKKYNRIFDWVYHDIRYKRARKIVLQRDGGICQECKKKPGIECHHKIPLDETNAMPNNYNVYICFSPRNMTMLCPGCHKKQRKAENNCANDVIITEDGEVIANKFYTPPGAPI